MAQHVVLPVFQGPLDLLLFLINRAQIDIKEIFVSNITEQYLEYTSQLEYSDMESKSSFLIMAARLLEIKSGKLLPKPVYEQEDEEDEEAKLIRQLQEYKLYKAACDKLKENEQEASKRFYRMPQEIMDRTELDLEGVDILALKNAFAQILERIEDNLIETPPQEIERDTFSVQEKIFSIRTKLLIKRKTTFYELFDEAVTKIEVIVTFLALLELSRHGRVSVKQGTIEEGILIEATDSTADDIEISEDE